jgi:kinesin family protein 6/9
VFAYCAQEAVSSVVDGYNSTIMCYGQTASGKTFTMTGSTQNYKYRGLIPRAINNIFSEVGGRFDTQITVKVSYLEIYNELLFDMLSTVPPHEQTGTSISILDDHKGEVHMKGLTMVHCKNEEEALNCLFEGETNRTTADNLLNKTSSRSHAIFTIHLESRSTIETSEKVIHSQLHLVDLAGNERTKKTGAEGLTLKEANYINRSLSYLEQVVVSTCDKKREHVPYRQCKLTNILKNSIGGNCKTILIANIFPEAVHLEETLSTLRFATRMRNVTNESTVNEALDQPLLIKKLEREIRDLKQELALHDVLASKGAQANVGDPYTAEESYELQQISE